MTKRKSRPEPQRPGYDRGYSSSFRESDSWDWPDRAPEEAQPGNGSSGNGSSGNPAAQGGWTDKINDGVRMGYRVIEEQIRQGQRVAEQINDRFYQAGPSGFEGQDVTQRMWRSYWDLAAMWWDFMGSMTGGGQGFRNQAPVWGNGDHSSDHVPERSAADLAIEVESERATRVGIVLNGGGYRSLVALKLHTRDGETLGGEVEFGPIVDGEPVRVEIRVPAEQRPGAYTGKIVDGSSGEHLGTLTVSVAE